MTQAIAGIVLAGGRSSRMGGGDKGLLALSGRPVLAHVLERFRPQVGPLALNANGDASRFRAFGLPVVADTVGNFAGPLAGVLAGLDWTVADTGLERMASVAADTPFLPCDLVARLAEAAAASGRIAVACHEGRRHPVAALWPVSVRAALRSALEAGERRMLAFLDAQGCVEAEFPAARWGDSTVDPFFNINTPSDLAEAERLLEGRRHG